MSNENRLRVLDGTLQQKTNGVWKNVPSVSTTKNDEQHDKEFSKAIGLREPTWKETIDRALLENIKVKNPMDRVCFNGMSGYMDSKGKSVNPIEQAMGVDTANLISELKLENKALRDKIDICDKIVDEAAVLAGKYAEMESKAEALKGLGQLSTELGLLGIEAAEEEIEELKETAKMYAECCDEYRGMIVDRDEMIDSLNAVIKKLKKKNK